MTSLVAIDQKSMLTNKKKKKKKRPEKHEKWKENTQKGASAKH